MSIESGAQAAGIGGRIGMMLVALGIGAVYGAVATVGHRAALRFGDVVIPWGLVAALIGVAALLIGIRLVADRSAAAAAAVGVVGVVALLALPGPGGSMLVVGDLVGTIWNIAPALIAVLVVAWPALPPRRRGDA